MKNNSDFIEYLAVIMECEYISDLHFAVLDDKKEQLIKSADEKLYSRKSIGMAADYLLNEKREYASAESAKNAVIDYYRKKPQR